VLGEAGVVDAGGAGFLLLLDAALAVLVGEPVHAPVLVVGNHTEAHRQARSEGALRYEVMYLLDLADDRIDAFRAAWGALGDSIVVVGGDGTWNCHVHTDDIGGAVEAALSLGGRPRDIRVTDLLDQVRCARLAT
jgi:dihydroxyacetone kinase-like predicted kinase